MGRIIIPTHNQGIRGSNEILRSLREFKKPRLTTQTTTTTTTTNSSPTISKEQKEYEIKNKAYEKAKNVWEKGHYGMYLAFVKPQQYKGDKKKVVTQVRNYLESFMKARKEARQENFKKLSFKENNDGTFQNQGIIFDKKGNIIGNTFNDKKWQKELDEYQKAYEHNKQITPINNDFLGKSEYKPKNNFEKLVTQYENKKAEKMTSSKEPYELIDQYNEYKTKMENTKEYKRENEYNKKIEKWQNRIKNTITEIPYVKPIVGKITDTGVEITGAVGHYVIKGGGKMILDIIQDGKTSERTKEQQKYLDLNRKESKESFKGSGMGYSQVTAITGLEEMFNSYSKEEDYNKKQYYEREMQKTYNKIMDLQNTPEDKIEIKEEWKRRLNEGMNIGASITIMGQIGNSLTKIGRNTIKRGNIKRILKNPKEIKIELNAVTLNKLKNSKVLKPDIKKILNKKELSFTDYIKITEASGGDYLVKGTIKGKNYNGGIIATPKESVTTITKKVGIVRPRTYIIRLEQNGDEIIQRIIRQKDMKVIDTKQYTYEPQYGITEAKNKGGFSKSKRIESPEGSKRIDYKEKGYEREVIQTKYPKKGDYKIEKGEGFGKTTIEEYREFTPSEYGVMQGYGEETLGTKTTKLLKGDLEIMPNRKVIERTMIDYDLLKKYGKKEGIKEFGLYEKSTKGKWDIRVNSGEEYTILLKKEKGSIAKFLENLDKRIEIMSKSKWGKRGQTEMFKPQITKNEVRLPRIKVSSKDLPLKENLPINLPKYIGIDKIKILNKMNLFDLAKLNNLNKIKLKIKNENIIMNKNEIKIDQKMDNKLTNKLQNKLKLENKLTNKFRTPTEQISITTETPRITKTPTLKPVFSPVWLPKKKKKEELTKKEINKIKQDYWLKRMNDPYLRITGKRKYSMDLLKLLKKRYGNVFT